MVDKLKIGDSSIPRKSAVIATKVNELIDAVESLSPGGVGAGVKEIIPGVDILVDDADPEKPIVSSATPVIVQNILSIDLNDQEIAAYTNYVIKFPTVLQDNNISVEDGGTAFSSDTGGPFSVHVTGNVYTVGLPAARTYFDVWMQTKQYDGLWENVPYSNKKLTVPEAGGSLEYTQGGIFLNPGWSVRFLFRTETADLKLKAETSSEGVVTPSARIAIARQGS